MLQHLQLEENGRRRQAEIGEVGGKTRRAADIGPDHGFGGRNGSRVISVVIAPLIARPGVDIN